MFVFHHSSCHSSYSRAVSLSLSSPSSQLYAYTLKVSVLFLLLTPYVKLVFISHYCCVQKNFIYFFKFFIKHTGLCVNSIIAVLALLSHWKFSQSCVNLSPLTLSLSRYSSVRSSIPVNFLRILVGILCHATVIWVFFERVFCVSPFIILFTLLDSCMGAVCKLLSSSSLPFLFLYDSSFPFSCFFFSNKFSFSNRSFKTLYFFKSVLKVDVMRHTNGQQDQKDLQEIFPFASF